MCTFVAIITKTMIQRIQTVFLLLATLVSAGLVFVFPLWETPQSESFFAVNGLKSQNGLFIAIGTLFFVSALITCCSIFFFKKRKIQLVLGRIAILINFILLGLLVYFSQNLPGETMVSKKGIGLLIPVITLIFIVIANMAIKKDEALVKSVDRLR